MNERMVSGRSNLLSESLVRPLSFWCPPPAGDDSGKERQQLPVPCSPCFRLAQVTNLKL